MYEDVEFGKFLLRFCFYFPNAWTWRNYLLAGPDLHKSFRRALKINSWKQLEYIAKRCSGIFGASWKYISKYSRISEGVWNFHMTYFLMNLILLHDIWELEVAVKGEDEGSAGLLHRGMTPASLLKAITRDSVSSVMFCKSTLDATDYLQNHVCSWWQHLLQRDLPSCC